MREIVATAPGRCGIVGNPSDMYGGNVLSCTVRERAECRLTVASAGFTVVNDDESAVLRTIADLDPQGDKIDIARAAFRFLGVDPAEHHVTVQLKTEIAMRAGMSGSTAMLASIVGVLDAYLCLNLNPYQIAETMRKIEARVMKVVCGFQDQHMAVFGGINFMNFAGKESLEQRDEEPYATIEPLQNLVGQLPFLLAHTGVQHHSGRVHASPRERWLAGEQLVRQNYAEIGKLAVVGKKALLAQDWETLGGLMNRNHELVSELGGSGPVNDKLIETARSAGAWGAKLAGAGGGGTILALTSDPETVGKALLDAGADSLYYPAPSPGLQVSVIS